MTDKEVNLNCRERKCFANKNGKCTILTSVDYDVGCPFFKTEEQITAERSKCIKEI